MKRITIAVLVALLVMILCGCSGRVEVVLPAELTTDISQRQLDDEVADGIYEEAFFNDDGSITYKMTKDQKSEMLDDLTGRYKYAVNRIVEDDSNAVSKIAVKDNFSYFDIYVTEVSAIDYDSKVVKELENMGRTYSAFSGEPEKEIKIEFVAPSL